jgi:DNA-binding CsgD family transcriptional regulator
MSGGPGSIVEWLSLYRPDPDDHFSESERAQCELLSRHLCEASKINRSVQFVESDGPRSLDDQSNPSFPGRGPSSFESNRTQRSGPEPQSSQFVTRYRITAAEWRVAIHLIEGWTATQIADALNLRLATVRSHISALLAKSGTRRQSQFVAKWMSEQYGQINLRRSSP